MVSVKAPNEAPVVRISSPDINSTFAAPASVVITATATDADGTVSKVEFYNGGTLLGTDATSPYNFTWNNVAEGVYNIITKATDNKGFVTISDAVEISVTPSIPDEEPDAEVPNVPPTVNITSPLANTSLVTPASIIISATAADAKRSNK